MRREQSQKERRELDRRRMLAEDLAAPGPEPLKKRRRRVQEDEVITKMNKVERAIEEELRTIEKLRRAIEKAKLMRAMAGVWDGWPAT